MFKKKFIFQNSVGSKLGCKSMGCEFEPNILYAKSKCDKRTRLPTMGLQYVEKQSFALKDYCVKKLYKTYMTYNANTIWVILY